MSKSEVDSFRGRSRASDDGPWKTDYAPMGSKTVIRRMAPYLPLTVEASSAIAEDEERELGLTPEMADLTGYDGDGVDEPNAKGEAAAEGGDAKSKEQAAQTPPSAAPSPEVAKGEAAGDPGAAFRS